jgi:acyl-CoA reductase-like NAD-dependent aldehyde dehydrogenase
MRRQRDRVEGYIATGVAGGATLAAGGGRPAHLDKGWYVQPTVFGNVDNRSVIGAEGLGELLETKLIILAGPPAAEGTG